MLWGGVCAWVGQLLEVLKNLESAVSVTGLTPCSTCKLCWCVVSVVTGTTRNCRTSVFYNTSLRFRSADVAADILEADIWKPQLIKSKNVCGSIETGPTEKICFGVIWLRWPFDFSRHYKKWKDNFDRFHHRSLPPLVPLQTVSFLSDRVFVRFTASYFVTLKHLKTPDLEPQESTLALALHI